MVAGCRTQLHALHSKFSDPSSGSASEFWVLGFFNPSAQGATGRGSFLGWWGHPSPPALAGQDSSRKPAPWALLEVGCWFYGASPWLYPQASILERAAEMATEHPSPRPCRSHGTHTHVHVPSSFWTPQDRHNVNGTSDSLCPAWAISHSM